jgi:hypothetical protein
MLYVHAYYTSGMHELAKVFVESFNYFHRKDTIPMIIHGVDITDSMRDDLHDRYPHLSVRVSTADVSYKAKKYSIPKKTLNTWKHQVEHGYVTQKNRAWKLMIAGEDRVCAVNQIVRDLLDDPNTIIVHFDIDTLFRSNIRPIEDEMMGYDVGLKLRPTIDPIKARITIDVMALRPVPYVDMWMTDWIHIAQSLHPLKRPIGYGQISCWEAYTLATHDDRLKALTLPLKYGLPGRNKKTDAIWCGNVHKLEKDACAIMFRDELDRLKKEEYVDA